MLVGCIKAMNGWRRCRAMWCSRKFDGRRTGVAAAFGYRRDGNDGAKVTWGAVFAFGKVRETLARSLKFALPKNLTNFFILISINPKGRLPRNFPLSQPPHSQKNLLELWLNLVWAPEQSIGRSDGEATQRGRLRRGWVHGRLGWGQQLHHGCECGDI